MTNDATASALDRGAAPPCGSGAPVRVRIAPSPTGDPHVGTAYIALFNYAFAKRHGGTFVLRIEDTDRTRSTRQSEDAILRALRWLGIPWQEGPDVGGPYGPYRQSERGAIYREHAELLLRRGSAYRCFCTAERLAALREDQRRLKRPPGYDGHCRGLAADESARRAAAGEAHVVRLAMPKTGETVVADRLRGNVSFQNEQIDDQVLLKSDGFPTYHLANVVDDHLMRISHVIRAEEWISSTPKHVVLYEAFGWQPPVWVHMPLLRNADKSKISKRRNPVSLDYYSDAGVLPEALRNYLGLMGWSFGGDREKFTLEEMVEQLDFDRVSLGGPVFDLEKLSWLNGLYLRELPREEVLRRLRAWRLSDEHLLRMIDLVQERTHRLDEFIPSVEYFLSGDLEHGPLVPSMVPKGRTAGEAATVLDGLVELLESRRDLGEAEALEAVCREYTDKVGWKTKELFSLLRTAVTGRTAAPPLFATMAVLGPQLTRRRLRQACDALRAAT